MEYEQWLDILSTINADNDLNESNVIKKIREELKKRNPDAYQEWVNSQFNINYTLNDQRTLLHIAAENGLAKVTELLIAEGADVDKKGRYGYTPLHYAIGGGFIEVVNVLIKEEADVNAVEESERTPLHHAGCYGHVEIVKALLYKGADFELKDKDGFTLLDHATNSNHLEVIDALNEFRATSKLSLKLRHALNKYKNNTVSSSTFSDASLGDESDFSDDIDWNCTIKTQELEAVTRDLGVANQKVLQERDSAQRELAAKTNELEDVKYQLREKERDLGVVNQRALQERDSAQRELAAKTNELEGVKYQLREKERDLGVVNQRALQERDSAQQELAAKTNELEDVKYQLREKERDLGVVNQRALQERGSAQRELAAKTKELNGKNKKFSEANTQSIRQGNYASTFFILSGVCAVGVSLTIPYLAICITFAVAASIFLAVGCYTKSHE